MSFKLFSSAAAFAIGMLLSSCGSGSRMILDGSGMERTPQQIRESCKLSTTFDKNTAGKVTHINLFTSFAGEEKKQAARIELMKPVDESFFDGMETLMENDLDFDGLSDVQVIKGKVGSTLYREGFLWNPDKYSLSKIDGFDRIPNPSPSTQGDAILGYCTDDPAEIVLYRYEWKYGHLMLVNEEHQRFNVDPMRGPTDREPMRR